MNRPMEIRQVLFHGYRLIMQDTAVTGGACQLHNREKHQLRLSADNGAFLHELQIILIKLLRFIGNCINI